jgi:hypothetical protein
MVFGWLTLKIMCNFHALHPRWLLLLKVEISLNGKKKKLAELNKKKRS